MEKIPKKIRKDLERINRENSDKFTPMIQKKIEQQIEKMRKARKEHRESWTELDESVLFSFKCHLLMLKWLVLVDLRLEGKRDR